MLPVAPTRTVGLVSVEVLTWTTSMVALQAVAQTRVTKKVCTPVLKCDRRMPFRSCPCSKCVMQQDCACLISLLPALLYPWTDTISSGICCDSPNLRQFAPLIHHHRQSRSYVSRNIRRYPFRTIHVLVWSRLIVL